MKRISALVALCFALAACKPTPASAAPPPAFVEVQSTPAETADSLCYGVWWPVVADTLGAAESYVVEVASSDTALAPHSRWTVTDHQTAYCLTRPAPGDSVRLTVLVSAVRRGLTGGAKGAAWTATTADAAPPAPDSVVVTPIGGGAANPNPPAGDVSGDSLPSPVGSLFATPRAESPHFDFARYTFTDFCYCGADTTRAARRYDLIMSGDAARWMAANPTGDRLRYTLLWSTLDEANSNADDLPNRYQWDARRWFAAHPEYDYESAWLHVAGDSTPADSAHRLHPHIWSTNRYVGNPGDPGWRAYTVDRYRRMAADTLRTGFFVDEMDDANLGVISKSREYAGRGAAWQDDLVSLVAEVREAIAPKRLQTNPAGYGYKPLDVRIALAAGAVHLETMNRATQELPSVWTLVDSLVRRGTYVDMVGLEAWADFTGGSSKLSRESYYPRGNEQLPVYRAKLVQLASYYMVVDSGATMVGAQLDGVRAPLTPDSVDLPIYYLDVGHPLGPRSVWLDTRDALSQRARVFRRDFDNATVLIRPVNYWADTVMTDTTAVPVPLPAGSWSMVTARGGIVPIDSLRLRNSEAVILVRRQ